MDKSGSMGCDKTSFGALCMSAQMALSPSEGSCLLVLLAGPGETQLFFTRAGGAARESARPLPRLTQTSIREQRVLLPSRQVDEAL